MTLLFYLKMNDKFHVLFFSSFSALWVFLEEKFGQKEANDSLFKFAGCL